MLVVIDGGDSVEVTTVGGLVDVVSACSYVFVCRFSFSFAISFVGDASASQEVFTASVEFSSREEFVLHLFEANRTNLIT